MTSHKVIDVSNFNYLTIDVLLFQDNKKTKKILVYTYFGL